MTTEQFARELFASLLGSSTPKDWDWQLFANRAFDAAENFEIVAKTRTTPPPPPTFTAPGEAQSQSQTS